MRPDVRRTPKQQDKTPTPTSSTPADGPRTEADAIHTRGLQRLMQRNAQRSERRRNAGRERS